MIREFNMDWKADCGQFSVAHATKTKQKNKLEQTNTSAQ